MKSRAHQAVRKRKDHPWSFLRTVFLFLFFRFLFCYNLQVIDLKIVLGIISALISSYGFYFYIKDTLSGKTQPHLYTWLIWILTQGTATAAMLYGGAGIGSIAYVTGTVFILLIFCFSFKYGTKNITTSDTVALIAAIIAIVVWWQLNNPVLALLMVCFIDAIGYVPTIRKSWQEPLSESLSTWIIFNVGNIFSILSLREYNFLTLAYLLTTFTFNFLVIFACLYKRKY